MTDGAADGRDDAADQPWSADVDPGPSRAQLAARMRRFERTFLDRRETQVRRLPWGVERLSPDLPLSYGSSTIEIERPVAVSELLSHVQRVFPAAGLTHRRISTYEAQVAWTLTPALDELGWTTERLVSMVHDGVSAMPVSPVGFEHVDADTFAAAARAFVADNEWGRDPATQDQLVERGRRCGDAVATTYVLARDGSAGCHVYRHGSIAQIEEVNVLAEARGRGLGEGLLAAAMHACEGASLTFLVADADDWPRRWYAARGFRAVSSAWAWMLLAS